MIHSDDYREILALIEADMEPSMLAIIEEERRSGFCDAEIRRRSLVACGELARDLRAFPDHVAETVVAMWQKKLDELLPEPAASEPSTL